MRERKKLKNNLVYIRDKEIPCFPQKKKRKKEKRNTMLVFCEGKTRVFCGKKNIASLWLKSAYVFKLMIRLD